MRIKAFTVLCVRCAFCSVQGHFDVNGYSDECASFCKDPYGARWVEVRKAVLLLSVCVQAGM